MIYVYFLLNKYRGLYHKTQIKYWNRKDFILSLNDYSNREKGWKGVITGKDHFEFIVRRTCDNKDSVYTKCVSWKCYRSCKLVKEEKDLYHFTYGTKYY